ncbi:alpha/beta hydrolase [Rossellomorea vietnamensis]|uniref:Carboxylesterase n=1 Tax=Rossellomorea vietnamensis TaxID=218284 RepID=A0A0P6WLD8_9BACI|nr:alpha/beta fold hydrolase [Rossellomorea vietnamensis]KPL58287.1 carboxylesterase [Rossellomorea vietnamensis]
MIGCLLIHGFTGSPFEVEPLAEFLRERTDWKIVMPTLPGHGETLELKGIKHIEWIEHTESELKALLDTCDKVYVIGFSMGGLIASYLSVKYDIDKLVLLSAAAYYINVKQLLKDIGNLIKEGIQGNIMENELYKRYKFKVTKTPILSTYEFRKVVRIARPLLQKVSIPTFIAQGENDGIVPPKAAKYIYETISSKKKNLFYSPEAKHLICHSKDKHELFDKIYQFLQSE